MLYTAIRLIELHHPHITTLILQQFPHQVQGLLQRLGIPCGTRVLAGVERGNAKDNFLRIWIVGTSVALGRYWAVAHEAVRGAEDLNGVGK